MTDTMLTVGETDTLNCVITLNTILGPDTSALKIQWFYNLKEISTSMR